MNSPARVSAVLGAILALAACGTTASPSTTPRASAPAEQTSQAPAVAVICASAPRPFDPNDINLTGAWAARSGGVYYIRDLGSVVWWTGMSGRDDSPSDLGRVWTNVARGEINGLEIDLEWADVPRGGDTGQGTVKVQIEDDGTGNVQLVQVSETGGFGEIVWTPCDPIEGQVAEYVASYGGEVSKYGEIMTLDDCEGLAALAESVTATMNTAEAGSPEFRAALGYSNAINERQTALSC